MEVLHLQENVVTLETISSLTDWNIHYTESSAARAGFYIKWISKYSPIKGETILDIGCGSGFFSTLIKKVGGVTISLDIKYRKIMEPNLTYILGDATQMPFRDGVIKIGFGSDVYEHIESQDKFLSENVRVLKKGGFVFFSTGNKFFPIDRHTGLPFIDLLPKRVASAWATKKKGRPYRYTVYEPTFYDLHKKLIKVSRHHIVDPRIFMEFYKVVYPRLYHKGLKWFNLARTLDRMGLLKFVTPKFYAIFKKEVDEPSV